MSEHNRDIILADSYRLLRNIKDSVENEPEFLDMVNYDTLVNVIASIELAVPGLKEDTDRLFDQVLDVDDAMDGDASSALASAGWGTDEDYGGTDDRI